MGNAGRPYGYFGTDRGVEVSDKIMDVVDWQAIFDNAEKQAKEQFGRLDETLPDMQRAWDMLASALPKD